MFRHILVPTDGSWGSREAVATAVELAADYDATLHALSVVDEAVSAAYSGDEYGHEHEGLEEAVRAVADAGAERDVPVETTVVHGTPHEAILEYATEADADLVVMGTKRRSDEYRQFVGSVTQRVVDLSPQPVLVVKSEE